MQARQASAARMRSNTVSFSRKKFSQVKMKVNRNTITINVAQAHSAIVPMPNRISGQNRNTNGRTNPAMARRMEVRHVFIKSALAMPEATKQPMATGGVTADISP